LSGGKFSVTISPVAGVVNRLERLLGERKAVFPYNTNIIMPQGPEFSMSLYVMPFNARFSTSQSRRREQLIVHEEAGLVVRKVIYNGVQAVGGSSNEPSWITDKPARVWRSGHGDFFLRRGAFVYGQAQLLNAPTDDEN